MKKILAAFAFVAVFVGCTNSQTNAAITASGQVCEMVVQSVSHPELAPLCTSAQAVAAAVAALVQARQGATGATAAGYAPSDDEVYAYLAAHGAKKVDAR
jgi:hypothetical protein